MSDKLFVTLYLADGFHKEGVEIEGYKAGDRPDSVSWGGRTFWYVGAPKIEEVFFDDENAWPTLTDFEGELVYCEMRA